MKPTVDIIGELLDGFNPSTTITAVVDNMDGTATITLCETLNLREQSPFTINAVDYIVSEINGNDITYETGTIPSVGDILIFPKPFYFHGTPIAVGNELATIYNSVDKLPMVYLYEIMRDEFEGDKNSAIDRVSDIRLFFLDEADFEQWDTDMHYSLAIVPMANYAKAFVDYLSNHKHIGLLQPYNLVYHAKFGISINQNGHVKNLFAEQLSGVEVSNLKLPIKKLLTTCIC